MKNKMFIPDRIKVGYQERSDTYTKRLAYIIYYDKKGTLRKEKSWQSWRDENIDPEEFENKPHSGFILNKSIRRCHWDHFSSGRNMIRVYDDRGIEFEITPGNLLFILMHTNCNKRELEGEFVYAWDGAELVLLPVGCEDYKNCKEFSSLQGQKVSAKDLIVGATYETKQQEILIYLGRYPWYEFDYYGPSKRAAKKKHVFFNSEGVKTNKWWDSKARFVDVSSVPSKIARVVDETPVSNLAEIMEEAKSCKNLNEVERLEWVENPSAKVSKDKWNILKSSYKAKKIDKNTFQLVCIYGGSYYDNSRKIVDISAGAFPQVRVSIEGRKLVAGNDSRNIYGNRPLEIFGEELIDKNNITLPKGYGDLYVVFKSGGKEKAEKYFNIDR